MEPIVPDTARPPHPVAHRLRTHPLLERVIPYLSGDVCVVGGMVRDALLGRPHLDDVDLVVEGDAVAVARELGRRLGLRPAVHERFGTATLELPHHGGHIDLITARRETYARPGALPDVVPGTLADDLARRDFTVNAMAVGVSGPRTGALIDPCGGVDDLAAGVVRSLRPGAFTEDPSRVVRAARYAARLGFTVDEDTWGEACRVAPVLDWSSSRVGEEMRRLMAEPTVGAALEVLAGMGAPGARRDAATRIRAVDAAAGEPHAPAFPLWALRIGAGLDPEAFDVLAVPGWARGLAGEVAAGGALAARLEGAVRPSQVDALLGAAPPAATIGARAAGAAVVSGWWEHHRDAVIDIAGRDLVAAGVAPGPVIGRALRAVRAAVLDGEVAGRDEQLGLALRVAREGA